jgi:ubiquinone/menaquinone biosynthesis C-methylase UbiE
MACDGPAAGPGAHTGSGPAGSTPDRTCCGRADPGPCVRPRAQCRRCRIRDGTRIGHPLARLRSLGRPRSVLRVADAHYENPRLAQIYDAFDGPRVDLDVYVALVRELGAHHVLDVGCGTGTFACLLAENDLDVVGLDPAAASLDVARTKPGSDRVRWILGDATALPPLQADLATMTGNVAQVFVTDEGWGETLGAIRRALRPGGYFVFETRIPEDRAWRRWTREASSTRVEVPGVGPVDGWVSVTDVAEPLVSFRWTFVFTSDGTELTSDSTLRFRPREELVGSLTHAGFAVRDVRPAPDRPGREFVFIAQRPHERP